MALVASVVWPSVRCSAHEGSEIVAINDLTSPDMLAYLLKYDSTQGNYSRDHKVESTEDSIIVDGKEIKIYKEADANNLPWGELDVDVVLECTGFYTSKEKAQAHINAGAKKVVISAPAGKDLPDHRLQREPRARSPLMTTSSPLLPAPPTASPRWPRVSTTSLPSSPAS